MELFKPEHIQRLLTLVDDEWVGQYGEYTLKSVFQPIWDKPLRKIYAYEGLLRVTKNGKCIEPLDFLNRFTSDTEIANTGALCASLHVRNYGRANLREKIFINLHPTIFARVSGDDYSMGKALERLALEGIDHDQIAWEITEFKESDTKNFISGLATFRRAGNIVAIDDYGQLESNKYRVDMIKPDIVKIDRELVRNYCNRVDGGYLAILTSMLNKLGCQIIMEGVELEREYQCLRSLQFDFIQGFYTGKPQSIHYWSSNHTSRSDRYTEIEGPKERPLHDGVKAFLL